jgi:hypothetical protein
MVNLDLCITYRCNQSCPNCVEFCGRKDITGLDYSDSDMTMEQIDQFCAQISATRPPLETLSITGGEPLLHPHLEEIVDRLDELRRDGCFTYMVVNSNKTIQPSAKIRPYIFNISEPKDNPQIHHCAFIHPSELGAGRHTYRACQHHRKPTVVLSYLGYSVCCAGDAYIRLFGYADLISNEFPLSAPAGMDKVCQQCPFGSEALVPFERDQGCPVSPIYVAEGKKNKRRKRIKARYHWPEHAALMEEA